MKLSEGAWDRACLQAGAWIVAQTLTADGVIAEKLGAGGVDVESLGRQSDKAVAAVGKAYILGAYGKSWREKEAELEAEREAKIAQETGVEYGY